MKEIEFTKKDAEKQPIAMELRSHSNYSPRRLFCKVCGKGKLSGIEGIDITSNPKLYVDEMQNEYRSLIMLYNALPNNVVRPILFFKMYDENAAISCGYIMEKLNGESIDSRYIIKDKEENDYDNPTKFVSPKSIRQKFNVQMDKDIGNLIKIVETLHTKKLGHGDLNPSNIILTQNGTIKLIDPLPYIDGNGINMNETIRLERTNTFRAWRNLHMLIRSNW